MTAIVPQFPVNDAFFTGVRAFLSRDDRVSAVLPPFDGLDAHQEAYSQRGSPPSFRDRPPSWLPPLSIFRTSDRVFLRPLPVNELLNYFWRLEDLCERYCKSLPPESVIIWPASPHFPWSLTLAGIAARLNHRVITLEATHLPNRIAAYEGVTFESPEFLRATAPIRHDYYAGKAEQSVRLRNSQSINFEAQTRAGSLKRLLRKFAATTAKIIRYRGARSDSYWSIYSYREKARFALTARGQHAALRREVKRLARTGQLPDDYALLPLHYQPERTTDPDAGDWRDQAAFVAAVRALLDATGRTSTGLIVKEHPRQAPLGFPDLRQLHYRHPVLYRVICEDVGATLVSTHQDLEPLARSASLVASVNGSAAWTSLSLGVPTLTARRSWFSDCSATITLDEASAEPELLNDILGMNQSDVRESLQTWRATEDITFPGLTMSQHIVGTDPTGLAHQMAESLAERLLRGT